MADNNEITRHTLLMENRNVLELTGISDVESCNEEEITADSSCGNIVIRGEGLSVEVLDLDCGRLKINGKIIAVIYTEKSNAKGFFKRLFS